MIAQATSGDQPVGFDGAAALDDLPEVAEFPTWNAATQRIQTRHMHDGHRKVLDALTAGLSKPGLIADATGYSTRRVHDILDELMDEFGKVERVLHADGKPKLGEYRLVDVNPS
ncbi:MAG TPA: hypothetical protein VI172_17035, partial [Candidatus Dormibacteraeota bacterium]